MTKNSYDALTRTTTAGIKNGVFDNLLIVDINGRAIRTKTARKLHGVGMFWGYNILYGQKIRAELVYDGEPFQMTVDDVRKIVLEAFRKFHGWRTQPDFPELKKSVEKATNISEIIDLVKD